MELKGRMRQRREKLLREDCKPDPTVANGVYFLQGPSEELIRTSELFTKGQEDKAMTQQVLYPSAGFVLGAPITCTLGSAV